MMTWVILEKGEATEKLWREVGTERNRKTSRRPERHTHTEKQTARQTDTDRQTGPDQGWDLRRLGGGSGHISSLGVLPVGSGADQSGAG